MDDMAERPPLGFPVEEALRAWQAHSAFWAALADDDDATTRDLFFELSRLRNGLPVRGLAAGLRERMT
jgi:hypothetical protein